MLKCQLLVVTSLLVLASRAFAADASPKAVQFGVAYDQHATCNSSVGVENLGTAYFGAGDLHGLLAQLMSDCGNALRATHPETTKIIVFLVRPTPNTTETTVAHVIYNGSVGGNGLSALLPGVTRAAWIYITEDQHDSPVSLLTVTPADNPLFAQLGNLVSNLEKPLEKLGLAAARHDLVVHIAPSVDLRAARSSITEVDYISTPKRDAANSMLDKDNKPTSEAAKAVYQQVSGNFAIVNAPRDWMTVNGAAGVLVGPLSGDQRMKVSNNTYASDPLGRGVAMAGVTFHAPYDSNTPTPTWRERIGVFVGGIVSPSAGAVGALSVGWRGVSFIVGYSAILVQTAPSGKNPGDMTPSGLNPQLVNGWSRSVVLGGSFALK